MFSFLRPSRHSYVVLLLLSALLMLNPLATSSQTSNEYVAPVQFDPADVLELWNTWQARYVTRDGAGPAPRLRVLNEHGTTVSEGQAYGILLASIFDEQDLLDNLWLFAADHLDRNDLMHWNIASYGNIAGTGAASDADFDMAMGMIYACQKVSRGVWPASSQGLDYCQIALELIDAIWETEIDFPGPTPPGGLRDNLGYEIIPGDMWNLPRGYPEGITNLSYFSPAYFRIFADFTNNDEWNRVIERQYELAEQTQTVIPGNCSGLVPNWSKYDATYQYVSWHGTSSEYFGWDGARFAWRVALDRHWFDSPEANIHMNRIGGFFSSVGASNVRAEYRLDGTAVNTYGNAYFLANAAAAIWAAAEPTPSDCGQASGSLISDAQDAYEALLQRDDDKYYEDSWQVLSSALMTGYFIHPGNVGRSSAVPTAAPDGDTPQTTPPTAPPQTATPLAPIEPQNRAPSIEPIAPQSTAEGSLVELQVIATDAEGDALRFDALGSLPPGLMINPETGLISGRVADNSAFTYLVLIEVADADGQRASITFDWEITPAAGIPDEPLIQATPTEAVMQVEATSTPLPQPTLVVDAEVLGQQTVDVVIRRDDLFNTQEAQFVFRLTNTGNEVLSDLSVRLYFTPDVGYTAQDYILDMYYDSSRGAAVIDPGMSGGSAYFTINYEGSLFPNASWEYQGNLHLNNWQAQLDTADDWWAGAGLAERFTSTDRLAVYSSGALIAGTEPNGSAAVAAPASSTQAPTQAPALVEEPGADAVEQADLSIVVRANGTDDNQQTQFGYRLTNEGVLPISDVSVRVYFQPETGRSASDYVLELYWDSTQSAEVTGPVTASDGTHYFAINYGDGLLFSRATWEYNGGLHLSDWASTFNSNDDFWRQGGLSSRYTETTTLPVYSGDQLIAGTQP